MLTETRVDVSSLTPGEQASLHEVIYLSRQERWLGYPMQKNPMDLMVYQNLLYDLHPDLLVETGTWHGGSALYYATIMDGYNHGIIITIDPWHWPNRPQHDRIQYCLGSSIDADIVRLIKTYADQCLRTMVVLDSDHTMAHVLKELDIYAPMVTPGQYLVVEDSNIHNHPIRPDLPAGPFEAIHEWLPAHPEFVIDKNVEPIVSNCPDGWLRRLG